MRIFMAATLAVAAMIAGAMPSAGNGGMAEGEYACWYFSEARLTLNFTVLGPDSYKGYDGTPGAYRLDPATGEVVFVSGTLEGVMPDGFKAVYEVREGVPTLSYISGRGAEAAFCQNA